jgi:hypothetical protein
MENENLPVIPDQSGLSNDVVKKITKSKWLPRVQLMTAGADKCKSGKFPINHYALFRSSDDMVDLGEEVDVLLICSRPKAMEISDEITSIYDIEHSEWERISYNADNTKDSGCMYGAEYLVWAPSIGFATFYLGSKSSRREIPIFEQNMKKIVRLSSKFIDPKRSKHSWWSIKVEASPNYFSEWPEQGELDDQFQKFVNPPSFDKEVAEEDDAGSER